MSKSKVGSGESDYEKYTRTVELLSLQKPEDDLANDDEMFFQVIHQAMELWMKAAIFEVGKVKRFLGDDDLFRAGKHVRRIAGTIDHIADGFDLLTTMTQADYHEIRLALGRGSGQDSPGFQGLLAELPTLWDPFAAALERHGKKLLDVMTTPHAEEHRGLYEAGMAMLEVDRKFQEFRYRHLQLARWQIGLAVKSLKGVPARAMEKNILTAYFPDLWTAVEDLTNETNPTYG